MRYLPFSLILLSFSVFAQTNKSIDIGLNAPLSIYGRVPSVALSPNINYCIGKNQFQLGIDVYENMMKGYANNIVGFQSSYKRLLLDEQTIVNVFVDFNMQYVQYADGASNPLPYKYSPNLIKYETNIFSLIRNKSFVNTLGIGFNAMALKRISFQFVLAGGYNYYQTDYSPTNITHYGFSNSTIGNRLIPIAYTRVGLQVKLWKNH